MRKKRIFGPRREGDRLKFAVSLTVVLTAFYIGYYAGLAQRPMPPAPLPASPPAITSLPHFPH